MAEQVTPGISATRRVQRKLEEKAWEAKEDRARWATDYPGRLPGESRNWKTWGSYSRQRRPCEAFRRGYDAIDWGGG